LRGIVLAAGAAPSSHCSDVEVQLQVNRATCALPEAGDLRAVDGISRETFTLAGDRLTVPLKARAFRMLRLEP
jgi:hypothetical protein